MVQAFRYEPLQNSDLKTFFLRKVFENKYICNSFHWLVHLDKENKESNPPEILEKYNELYDDFVDKMRDDYIDYYENIALQL